MKLYLIVAKGKHQGMPIPISVDLFMMGSDHCCQLRSQLPGIASRHCALVTRGKKVFVHDLGGDKTLLNGELVPPGQEWPVHAGDRLVVGPLEFMIQFHEKQLSQKDAEEWALKALDTEAGKEYKEEDEGALDDSMPHAARPPATASASASAILDKLQAQKGVVVGRLRITQTGDVTVLRFNDAYLVEESEITFIKRELVDTVTQTGMRILLDFKNVTRMSSAAMEMIQDFRRRVRAKMGAVAMCRVRADLLPMMQALGIIPGVRYFPDKKAALDEKW